MSEDMKIINPKSEVFEIGNKIVELKPLPIRKYINLTNKLVEIVMEFSKLPIIDGKITMQSIIDFIISGKVDIISIASEITGLEKEYLLDNMTVPNINEIVDILLIQNQWDIFSKKVMTLPLFQK